jgi:hypothetical protein
VNVRNLSLILVLAVVSIAIAAWLFTARTHAQTRNNDPWQVGGPNKVIDSAARELSPENETSVRTLTEAVFSTYPHVFGQIPAPFDSGIKDALTHAELAHLQGSRPGVSEQDVANLVNMWADRLHLPQYAKTSAKQVRVLRMSLAVASPVFMGRNIADPGSNSAQINPELSPLQAIHLTSVLLDQKFLDPDYQVTPEEWERTFQQKQVEKIQRQAALAKAATTSGQPGVYLIAAHSNPKLDEMRQAFDNGITALSTADTSDLVNSSLRTLGIDSMKEEGKTHD